MRAVHHGGQGIAGNLPGMFRFVISALRESGHGSVQRLTEWTLPISGTAGEDITDSDGDSWFYTELDAPISYMMPAAVGAMSGPGTTPVTEVLLRPHFLDEQPTPGMRSFLMDFAVVLDPSMRASGVIDLNRVDYIAVVEVDDAGPVEKKAAARPTEKPAESVAPPATSEVPETLTAVDPMEAPVPAPVDPMPQPEPVAAPAARPSGDPGPVLPGLIPAAPPNGLHDMPPAPAPRPEPVPPRPLPPADVPARADVTPAEPRQIPPTSVPPISQRPLPPTYVPPVSQRPLPPTYVPPISQRERAFPARDEALRADIVSESEAPGRFRLVAAATAAVALVTGAVLFVTTRGDDEVGTAAASTTVAEESTSVAPSTPSPPPPAKPADLERLSRMLPRGYTPQSCGPAESLDEGRLAAMECSRNSDVGGPVSGRYTLFADSTSLTAAFDRSVAASEQQICPGNILSPGPWRRNAAPDKVAGTLFCGLDVDRKPVVIWSDTERRLLQTVQGGPGGPDLEALYGWWSQHS